jgi:hypothetical protein
MEKKIENKIQIAKAVGGIIIGIGVTSIVNGIVKNNTPSSTRALTKLCIGVTAIVIGTMAADKVTEYTDGKIEEVAFCIQKIQMLTKVNSEEV